MSRVTIKDLARHLNLNPSTISRALRDHPEISVTMRVKIKDLAERMGYRPNLAAINLRKGQSRTIGLIVSYIPDYFYPGLIKAVESFLSDRGYNLLILQSNNNIAKEIQNAGICAQLGVEGLLVSLTSETDDLAHFAEFNASEIPVVFLDKINYESPNYKITIPGKGAAFEAVNHLIDINPGTTRLTGFFGDKRLSITQDRLEGFMEVIRIKNLNPDEQKIFFCGSASEAKETYMKFVDQQEQNEGVFVMSDEILEGLVMGANALNLNPVSKGKIVCMSDGHLPRILPWGISYVLTSGEILGREAAALLFELIDGNRPEVITRYIETPLIYQN